MFTGYVPLIIPHLPGVFPIYSRVETSYRSLAVMGLPTALTSCVKQLHLNTVALCPYLRRVDRLVRMV